MIQKVIMGIKVKIMAQLLKILSRKKSHLKLSCPEKKM